MTSRYIQDFLDDNLLATNEKKSMIHMVGQLQVKLVIMLTQFAVYMLIATVKFFLVYEENHVDPVQAAAGRIKVAK